MKTVVPIVTEVFISVDTLVIELPTNPHWKLVIYYPKAHKAYLFMFVETELATIVFLFALHNDTLSSIESFTSSIRNCLLHKSGGVNVELLLFENADEYCKWRRETFFGEI